MINIFFLPKKGSYTRARSIRSFIYFGLLFLRFLVKQLAFIWGAQIGAKRGVYLYAFSGPLLSLLPPIKPFFSQNFRWVLVLFPLYTRVSAENWGFDGGLGCKESFGWVWFLLHWSGVMGGCVLAICPLWVLGYWVLVVEWLFSGVFEGLLSFDVCYETLFYSL